MLLVFRIWLWPSVRWGAVGISIAFHCFELLLPSGSRRAENAASSFPVPYPASSAVLAHTQAGRPKPRLPDQEEQFAGDGSMAPGSRQG